MSDKKFKNLQKYVMLCYVIFILSFILAISIAPLQVLYYSEALPTTAWTLYRSFTPRGAQATAGKGLAQRPYVAARVGVNPTTLRLKVIVSTKSSSQPRRHHVLLTYSHPVISIQRTA